MLPIKGNHRTRYVEQEGTLQSHTGSDAWGMFAIKAIQEEPDAGIHVEVKVNGIPIHMELDTGASVTIISERTWQAKMAAVPLQKSGILLKMYTGERLKVLGEAQVQVTYNTQQAQLPIVVVEGNGPSLFGRNWLKAIQLNWKYIKHISTELEALLQKNSVLFKDELGTMIGLKARLTVKPCRCSPQVLPSPTSTVYALREAMEKDLARLERQGVIEKVSYSDWATPVVPVPKPDGSG